MGIAHRVSNALALSARPIAATEFVNALSSIWKPREYNHKREIVGQSSLSYLEI